MDKTGIPQDLQNALIKFDSDADAIVTKFVGQLAQQEPPALAYHYTNDAGLRGILETGRFWQV